MKYIVHKLKSAAVAALTAAFVVVALVSLCGIITVYAEEGTSEEETTTTVVLPVMITATYSGSIKQGFDIDKSRFTVFAYYSDETSRTLGVNEFEISPGTALEVGNNIVTVSYRFNNVTVTTGVTVIGRANSNLSKITAAYTGGNVMAGDPVDRGDVKVTAYYGDGTSAEVNTWYFANYTIVDGTNVVYIIYEEDGYIRNCPIRITGKSVTGKQLVSISAEYTGDDLTAGSKIDGRDVQVSAYFKYISANNTVTTSIEGVTDWMFDSYTIRPGSNTVKILYEYDGVKASATIKVEGLDYEGNWVTYNGFYRFQNNDGTYKTNEWYEEKGEVYHFNDAGNVDIGWCEIDNRKYYFDSQGKMSVGWKNIRGTWYYFSADGYTGGRKGSLVKNSWVKDGLYWYYLLSDGSMAANCWIKDAERWYYLSGNGIMATGWFRDNGIWYFLTGSGAMATGWYQVKDKWYYADKNGALLTNTWIDIYYVDETGVWVATK